MKAHPDNYAVVPQSNQHITKEKIKSLLPKGSSTKVTDEIVTMIHNLENDTGLPQTLLEEDVMSYMHLVGKIGGIGITELINAIKFCNLKRNMNNRQAWSIVFPEKFNELTTANKEVDNFVSMYNNSKLVVAIDREMLVPVHIQYNAYFHAAVKKQYDLMNGIGSGDDDSVTPMVQHLAAKELAILTKMPEDKSIEIKVGASDVVLANQQEMNNHLAAIVAQQKAMFMEKNISVSDIQRIHTIDVVEVEN